MSDYKYSLLRYKPSIQREEFINVGLLFHSPKNKYLEFKLTNEWNRVKVFSGNQDISLLKESAQGIFDIVNQNQLINEKNFSYSDKDILDRITRSLLDFYKLHALFEKHNVEFVSIEESFDTIVTL